MEVHFPPGKEARILQFATRTGKDAAQVVEEAVDRMLERLNCWPSGHPVYTGTVYTEYVRNITLSADDDLIERARLRAAQEKTTLNAAFRVWLERYAGAQTGRQEYNQLMKTLAHVRSGKRFSREEMNER